MSFCRGNPDAFAPKRFVKRRNEAVPGFFNSLFLANDFSRE